MFALNNEVQILINPLQNTGYPDTYTLALNTVSAHFHVQDNSYVTVPRQSNFPLFEVRTETVFDVAAGNVVAAAGPSGLPGLECLLLGVGVVAVEMLAGAVASYLKQKKEFL